MSPEQKRKFNTVFGSVFMASGAVAWLLTVYFAMTPNPPKPAPAHAAPVVDVASCRSALSTFGYEVGQAGDEVTLFEQLAQDPQQQLDKATMAASLCKFTLKKFCMGEACERPGLTMVLAKPVEAPRPAKVDASAPAGTTPAQASASK